jgi:hypothetical protein
MKEEIVQQNVVATIAISCGSDSGRCMVSYNVEGLPTSPFMHPSAAFNPKYLNDMLGKIRPILDRHARAYNTFRVKGDDTQSLSRQAAAAWHELALWGRELYRTFFDLELGKKSTSNELEVLREFLMGQQGSRIMIDGGGGNLPWGLMYDDLVPAKLSEGFFAEVKQHFWGLRYQLELVPKYPTDSILWRNVLDNEEETRMGVTINKEVGEDYGPRHIKFFKELMENFRFPEVRDPPSVKLFNARQELLDNILERHEPQHLLYFFCHHKKGNKLTSEGWYEFAETAMVVSGSGENEETDETLSVQDLKNLELIPKFERANPVIFMNACESSQTEVGDPSGFMLYFIEKLSAGAFIGTEARIPTAFAHHFGQRFIREFVLGRPIGQILFDSRRYYAMEHNNFFGLYYSLYGRGTIRLSRRLDEQVREPST